ncbi:Yip1 family protein [Ectobacillus sp. sgz5001026]|uniref:Yip1 family protein n=1 Tax=Ectobacillus sp. sgz5001026 TaxID=3242473 RepID=UPI0036D2FF19
MEPNVPMEEVVQKPSLLGMITSPSEQFERMKGKVKIAVPMIVLILSSALLLGIIAYFQTKTPEFTQKVTPEIAGYTSIFVIVAAVVGGIISMLVSYFVGAAVYKIIAMITGSDITYTKILAITVYASVIGLIGTLINVLLMLVIGGTEVSYTSLAPLFEKGTVLYALGSSLNIFTIWQYAIIALGFQVAGEIQKNKAITIVVTLFVLTTLLSVGIVSLGSLISSAIPK